MNLIEKRPRIDVADALRGFAVMGIIILHCIEHFNFYSFPDKSGQSVLLNFTDKAVWDSLFFTFGGKAYAIFALLFGFSFFIQDDNQQQKGKDFRLRFMWRLVLLFVIGNINAMFFTGEILVLYSIVGFILVLTCRLPNKIVLALALILLIQPMEWAKVISALLNPDAVPEPNMSSYYFKQAFEVQTNGNFWQTVKMNLWDGQLASLTWAWENGRFFQTGALFLLGMLIGRKGLFVFSEKNIKTWIIVLIISLICFFPLTGLRNMLPDFVENKVALKSLRLIVKSLADFSFMLVLVSSFMFIFYSTKINKLLSKLIPYGKMSLTNYLTQSMIGSMLFYGWGFGLYQYLGVTYSALLGVCLFVVQLMFCTWWLKHFRQGPFEYLWKKATWIKFSK